MVVLPAATLAVQPLQADEASGMGSCCTCFEWLFELPADEFAFCGEEQRLAAQLLLCSVAECAEHV